MDTVVSTGDPASCLTLGTATGGGGAEGSSSGIVAAGKKRKQEEEKWTEREGAGTTAIEALPDEILLKVLSLLFGETLMRSAPQVCKRWRKLCPEIKNVNLFQLVLDGEDSG